MTKRKNPVRAAASGDKYDATNIRVLGGIEAVRKRPAMYVGDTGARGLHQLVEEVVANAVDEAMAGQCTAIEIVLRADGSCTVSDNGRGIPVDIHKDTGKSALEVVMTMLHAGGKFDQQSYKVSGGLHGVGVSCVNALSAWLTAEVRRDEQVYFQEYAQGVPVTPLERRGKSTTCGTRITFKPDPEIFGTVSLSYEMISSRARELAFLNKGLRISVMDERTDRSEEFHFEGGLEAFVEYLSRDKNVIHRDVIYLQKRYQAYFVEIALQYNDGYSETVLSFANNINTHEGGTHVSGFRAALTRTLNQHGRTSGALKDGIQLSGEDYREGLTAVVSIKLPEPQFEGQTKTKLGNREAQSVVEQLTNHLLGTYCEEHPATTRAICSKAGEAARAREAARRARDLARRKGGLTITDLPGKLADCSSREVESAELFLVEGISAGGTAKQGRDRMFQAILPLRGVVLNVEKTTLDKVLANEEIRTLVSALGTGIGSEEFNPAKIRYGKVVIMTDADIDGAHIRTLLLTFFFRQMPALIEQGRIYIAQPPLFKVKRKKQEEYIFDERQLHDRLLKLGLDGARLVVNWGRGKKTDLGTDDLQTLLSLCERMEAHAMVLKRRGLAMDGYLQLRRNGAFPLYAVHTAEETHYLYSDEELQSFLAEEQRRKGEVEILEETGRTRKTEAEAADSAVRPPSEADTSPAAAPDKAQAVQIVEIHESREMRKTLERLEGLGFTREDFLRNRRAKTPVYNLINNSDMIKAYSLSEILSAVRKLGRKGVEIQRYKGLGEMNAEELAETTMNPATRTLLRVSIQDAGEADHIFTLLAGKEVAARRKYIEDHAHEVRNLDV